MRILLLFILLHGFQSLSVAQEIVMRTFVKNDTVQLRWAPRTYDGLVLGLKNGYAVVRTVSGNETKLTVPSFNERRAEVLQYASSTVLQLVPVIENIIGGQVPDINEKQMIYGLLLLSAGPDKDLAKLLGLYFEDVPGVSADYRIEIISSELSSGEARIDMSRKDRNVAMSKLEGQSRNRALEAYIKWNAVEVADGYSGFWIEKSMDSLNYKRLNDVPAIFFKSQDEKDKQFMDYVDTLVEEGQAYFYRVQGINHFGDLGEVSNVVRVYIPRSLSGECRIDTVYADGFHRHIKGRFLFHTDSDIGNLKEFALYSSDSLNFGYEKIQVIAPVRNTYSFDAMSKLLTGDRQHYKVAAVSQDSDTTWSYPQYFFTLDQEPPEKPVGLAGEISDSGVVFLRWNPNTDGDIRGYRVFMANDLKEEFVEVTKDFVEDSLFMDTLPLRNLTSEVYYKIAAVDRNYNNSDYSDWVLLLKPDTIAPVPCVFTNYTVTDSGVVLSWINSTSSDVKQNKLVRIDVDGRTDSIWSWQLNSYTHFVDSIGLMPGQLTYFIQTHDEVPNYARSQYLSVQYELGYRASPDLLKAEVDRKSKQIVLTWEVKGEELYSVDIYRSFNDEPLKLIASVLEKFESGYKDVYLQINNTYTYKIKATYKSGVSSRISDSVSVKY